MGFVWGLKKKTRHGGLKAEREVGGGAGLGGGLTDVQPFERKLNKYLISQRSSAPWRWPLSQAF